jgi:FkbM family methyltransferase
MDWSGNKYIHINGDELKQAGGNITIIDGGAAGELFPPFHAFRSLCDVIRFEPRGDKYVDINANETSMPWALSSKRQKLELKVTRQNTCSSVFWPNKDINTNYLAEDSTGPREVLRIAKVDATSIDNEISRPVDVVKLDIHGSELDALIGATNTLKTAKFVLVETWTQEVYKGQPLHHDVDAFLRDHGYEALDIQVAAAWERPSIFKLNSIRKELIGLEVLYFNKRDFELSNSYYKYSLLLSIFGFTSFALWICDNKSFQFNQSLKNNILTAHKKHQLRKRFSLKFILQAIAARL